MPKIVKPWVPGTKITYELIDALREYPEGTEGVIAFIPGKAWVTCIHRQDGWEVFHSFEKVQPTYWLKIIEAI